MSPPTFTSRFISLIIVLLILLTLLLSGFVTKLESNQPQFDPSLKISLSKNGGAETEITRRSKKLETGTKVIINGNSTISSEKRTFVMGFFATNEAESKWYLSIRYASIPTPTYVWVANRENPTTNATFSTLLITETGTLAIIDSQNSVVWQSTNTEKATRFSLLETGNLVLFSSKGSLVWQSFDYPTDTWLPGMNLTADRYITSWKSLFDPSPGFYSLKIKPSDFNEIEAVYNSTNVYWSTGNWTGTSFVNVPEMTIRYIYKFHFVDPYLPTASFGYTEVPTDNAPSPPLTRFHLDPSGQLKQYTWSPQAENWNMFWSQPEDKCKVYGLCGDFGFCKSSLLRPCMCFDRFRPVDVSSWNSGDYSRGCTRESKDLCNENDKFEEVGVMGFSGAITVTFSLNRRDCEMVCLGNCSCIGLYHNARTDRCKNVYGTLFNLRNLTTGSTYEDVLYLRVPRGGTVKKNISTTMVLVASIVGSVAVLVITAVLFLIFHNKRKKRKGIDEDGWFFPPWAAHQIIEGNIAAVVDNRLGGAYNTEEAARVALVAIWCIQDDEEMRPTMGMVVKMLEGVVEVTIPPPPRLIQALVSGESYRGVQIDSAYGVSSIGGGCSGDKRVSTGGSHSQSSFGNISSPINENVNVFIDNNKPVGETDQS
ncbi:hypothetical protein EZV62_009899 [Acer yangbiense]|uniref:Bulb-type lectin domain-containing protein n=1 Tax=Acer yangbiense TaxID=1000413 RepID=A0A5C7I1E8_9ROSI|nr:hypothetical protein EZV62_009899 [Acer yangbiense]